MAERPGSKYLVFFSIYNIVFYAKSFATQLPEGTVMTYPPRLLELCDLAYKLLHENSSQLLNNASVSQT